ncbi:hypothetical protein [Caldimonas brevitalea]|uniref:Uncharacterized protein n=1 Tax=Caldimonas brevitalea TaxID=413882 RepID=A0A0G3BSD6_9BURK|nr:hypothetical protein [Caldimonas brevitalea]AKJ30918.1 hypothetical protein AAW51_4227 [Caldimonas brevitalea]
MNTNALILWGVGYAAVGALAGAWVYRHVADPALRVLGASFVWALFFSLSLVVDRLPIPRPTLLLLMVVAQDWLVTLWQEGCPYSARTCHPRHEGDFVVLAPLLLQWMVWLIGVFAVDVLRPTTGAQWRHNLQPEQTPPLPDLQATSASLPGHPVLPDASGRAPG